MMYYIYIYNIIRKVYVIQCFIIYSSLVTLSRFNIHLIHMYVYQTIDYEDNIKSKNATEKDKYFIHTDYWFIHCL